MADKTIDPKSMSNAKRKKPFVPKRNYYHSHTFLKIKDHEWENGVDSDDEDQSWREEIATSVSSVFVFVSKKGSLFMSFIRILTLNLCATIKRSF